MFPVSDPRKRRDSEGSITQAVSGRSAEIWRKNASSWQMIYIKASSKQPTFNRTSSKDTEWMVATWSRPHVATRGFAPALTERPQTASVCALHLHSGSTVWSRSWETMLKTSAMKANIAHIIDHNGCALPTRSTSIIFLKRFCRANERTNKFDFEVFKRMSKRIYLMSKNFERMDEWIYSIISSFKSSKIEYAPFFVYSHIRIVEQFVEIRFCAQGLKVLRYSNNFTRFLDNVRIWLPLDVLIGTNVRFFRATDIFRT